MMSYPGTFKIIFDTKLINPFFLSGPSLASMGALQRKVIVRLQNTENVLADQEMKLQQMKYLQEMKERCLDLCSVALILGIGHSSFLQSSKRVVLGPPFFVFTVTITRNQREENVKDMFA